MLGRCLLKLRQTGSGNDQQDWAKEFSVTRQAVSAWEQRTDANQRIGTLQRYERLIGVRVPTLVAIGQIAEAAEANDVQTLVAIATQLRQLADFVLQEPAALPGFVKHAKPKAERCDNLLAKLILHVYQPPKKRTRRRAKQATGAARRGP